MVENSSSNGSSKVNGTAAIIIKANLYNEGMRQSPIIIKKMATEEIDGEKIYVDEQQLVLNCQQHSFNEEEPVLNMKSPKIKQAAIKKPKVFEFPGGTLTNTIEQAIGKANTVLSPKSNKGQSPRGGKHIVVDKDGIAIISGNNQNPRFAAVLNSRPGKDMTSIMYSTLKSNQTNMTQQSAMKQTLPLSPASNKHKIPHPFSPSQMNNFGNIPNTNNNNNVNVNASISGMSVGSASNRQNKLKGNTDDIAHVIQNEETLTPLKNQALKKKSKARKQSQLQTMSDAQSGTYSFIKEAKGNRNPNNKANDLNIKTTNPLSQRDEEVGGDFMTIEQYQTVMQETENIFLSDQNSKGSHSMLEQTKGINQRKRNIEPSDRYPYSPRNIQQQQTSFFSDEIGDNIRNPYIEATLINNEIIKAPMFMRFGRKSRQIINNSGLAKIGSPLPTVSLAIDKSHSPVQNKKLRAHSKLQASSNLDSFIANSSPKQALDISKRGHEKSFQAGFIFQEPEQLKSVIRDPKKSAKQKAMGMKKNLKLIREEKARAENDEKFHKIYEKLKSNFNQQQSHTSQEYYQSNSLNSSIIQTSNNNSTSQYDNNLQYMQMMKLYAIQPQIFTGPGKKNMGLGPDAYHNNMFINHSKLSHKTQDGRHHTTFAIPLWQPALSGVGLEPIIPSNQGGSGYITYTLGTNDQPSYRLLPPIQQFPSSIKTSYMNSGESTPLASKLKEQPLVGEGVTGSLKKSQIKKEKYLLKKANLISQPSIEFQRDISIPPLANAQNGSKMSLNQPPPEKVSYNLDLAKVQGNFPKKLLKLSQQNVTIDMEMPHSPLLNKSRQGQAKGKLGVIRRSLNQSRHSVMETNGTRNEGDDFMGGALAPQIQSVNRSSGEILPPPKEYSVYLHHQIQNKSFQVYSPLAFQQQQNSPQTNYILPGVLVRSNNGRATDMEITSKKKKHVNFGGKSNSVIQDGGELYLKMLQPQP